MKRATLSAFAVILLLFLVLLSCSGRMEREHRQVRRAACRSYVYLAEGRHADYVSCLAASVSADTEQLQALGDMAAEYAALLQSENGGLASVTPVGDTIWGDTAHVFLQLIFADGASEQLGVPMVRQDGKWRVL